MKKPSPAVFPTPNAMKQAQIAYRWLSDHPWHGYTNAVKSGMTDCNKFFFQRVKGLYFA